MCYYYYECILPLTYHRYHIEIAAPHTIYRNCISFNTKYFIRSVSDALLLSLCAQCMYVYV